MPAIHRLWYGERLNNAEGDRALVGFGLHD
jgi:hypothetical protein